MQKVRLLPPSAFVSVVAEENAAHSLARSEQFRKGRCVFLHIVIVVIVIMSPYGVGLEKDPASKTAFLSRRETAPRDQAPKPLRAAVNCAFRSKNAACRRFLRHSM